MVRTIACNSWSLINIIRLYHEKGLKFTRRGLAYQMTKVEKLRLAYHTFSKDIIEPQALQVASKLSKKNKSSGHFF